MIIQKSDHHGRSHEMLDESKAEAKTITLQCVFFEVEKREVATRNRINYCIIVRPIAMSRWIFRGSGEGSGGGAT